MTKGALVVQDIRSGTCAAPNAAVERGNVSWCGPDSGASAAQPVGSAVDKVVIHAAEAPPVQSGVGGNVPATLALTLGTPASFGAFTPGLAHDYTASTTAGVTSTAGDAALTAADPSSTAPGRLVNGTFALASPLQVAAPAAAADWTVTPAANSFGAGRQSFGYTVNPGGQVKDGIVVVNHGATPLHLLINGATASGVSAWVRPERDAVTVAPGGSAEVPFVLALPKDAAPGDYVGGIVTSAAQDRVGVRIRLRVGGALKPSLTVERMRVHYSDSPNPLGKGDASVTYTIHNTGNAILTARQSVSLFGPFGRWDVHAGKLADSPPLLPGQRWKVSAPLRGVAPALRLTATVTLVPLLTDAAGSIAPLSATRTSGHAVIVPWALLAVIVVLCGLVAAGLAWAVARKRATAR